MSITFGGAPVTVPEYLTPDQEAKERAAYYYDQCWDLIKRLHRVNARLDKRWAWREANQHLLGTELYEERIAKIHDDFAKQHGCWTRLVHWSAKLQAELEKWEPKNRNLWCACVSIDYPCAIKEQQIGTSIEVTAWANVAPF